jgi:hypothetical protein
MEHRQTAGKLDPSSSPKTDCYLVSLDNDGNLSATTGKTQHLIEFIRVCPYVEEDRLVPIGFPSLACIGSTRSAENHYFRRHLIPSYSVLHADVL